MKGFTQDVSELSEAWQDYFNWKRHVEEKKRIANHPDIFESFESAKKAAKCLIGDFDDEPDDSVITIFQTGSGKFKIDAISITMNSNFTGTNTVPKTSLHSRSFATTNLSLSK